MGNAKFLQTEDDYKRALKEIEVYFDNQPEPGTEAGDRFELLAALIKEYEDVHYSISERQERDGSDTSKERATISLTALRKG